ncbi:MAG TPA: hypothetical protein VLQ93_02340, partial [Myxococcaceae bacterium]|nr:hypothetical protein [Myxococcaceae bacterium]
MESKHTSTGLTLVLTLVLAVGLSLAPIPEWLRPIPSLGQEGELMPRLVALVSTSGAASRRKAGGVTPDGESSSGPSIPELPEEEEEPAELAEVL